MIVTVEQQPLGVQVRIGRDEVTVDRQSGGGVVLADHAAVTDKNVVVLLGGNGMSACQRVDQVRVDRRAGDRAIGAESKVWGAFENVQNLPGLGAAGSECRCERNDHGG